MGNPLADSCEDFFELGGGVLYSDPRRVTFFMWVLILERQWYYRRTAPSSEVRTAIEIVGAPQRPRPRGTPTRSASS